MARLLILVAVGAAVWFVARAVARRSRAVVETLRQAEAALAKKAPMTLEKDPKTGVYRPSRAED